MSVKNVRSNLVSLEVYRHMKTHTGEKPCSCVECQRQFSVAGQLKTHMKTHREDNTRTEQLPASGCSTL